jgi:hypothetical protein
VTTEGLITAAGTGGGCGTLTWVFSAVKGMVCGGDSVVVLIAMMKTRRVGGRDLSKF